MTAAGVSSSEGDAARGSGHEAAPDDPHRGAARGTVAWLIGGAMLLALMAVSVLLRSRGMDTSYWIDEGIAVGVARHPLFDIPSVLLLDGSPPLYYMMLHVWESWFGTHELATRSLSLVAATLTIPAAWLLAWRIAGARAAWIAALIAAGHPFLTYYAQETRMYAWVTLEALILAGALVLVFVHRRRSAVPLAVLAATALVYSHNWGLFAVLASFGAALLVVFTGPREDRRASVIDGVLIYATLAVLYLPWVPSLLKQASSTGAPWSMKPPFADLFSSVVVPFGYEKTGVLLAVIVAIAAVVIARRDRPGDEPTARAAVLLFAMIALTGLIAWTVSQVSPAWSVRYLAVSVGPAILLAGLVLARVPTVGAAVLCLLALAWAQPLVERISAKSNVAQVAGLAAQQGLVRDGTVLVSPHPEHLPVIAHYFGPVPDYATALGWQRDTRLFDWRHGMDRLEGADPAVVWAGMRPSVESGDSVLLAVPILRSASWKAPWTELVRARSLEWQMVLDADPELRRLGELPRYGDRPLPRGIRLVAYQRR